MNDVVKYEARGIVHSVTKGGTDAQTMLFMPTKVDGRTLEAIRAALIQRI